MAGALQVAIGQRLVAYATGTRSPQNVGRWASRAVEPRGPAEQRLRSLYRTYLILRRTEDDRTVRAWLLGANPELNDQAPIELLRSDEDAAVFRAAEAFVED